MPEIIPVSEISYRKGQVAFEELSASTGFLFVPVEDDEAVIANRIRIDGVRAFVADIPTAAWP